jgi:hypothetical protein
MLRFLEKILQDIRKGRNLEVFLTLVVVLVLLFLDVFGVVSTEVVAAGTLATLALLCYSTLTNREQMQRLMDTAIATQAIIERKASDKLRVDELFWKEKRLLEEELAQARFIGIVGVTLGGTVRIYRGTFEERLASGAHIRFILIDPASEATRHAKLRSQAMVRDSSYAEFVQATIELICILVDLTGPHGTVELGLLPYAPSFGMVLIDPDEDLGRIIVEIYQHKSLALNPTFELDPERDPRWYKFFHEQFDLLWESCEGRRWVGDQIHTLRQESRPRVPEADGQGLGEAMGQK